ncbi:hypothetical protein, partial [Desulfofundulus thermobenzoicus]|uniref:hypothetical protein n=1 Tax=Desulfofundulus thermobenzoicus TaxID=29376 RepID=UPI001A9B1A7E
GPGFLERQTKPIHAFPDQPVKKAFLSDRIRLDQEILAVKPGACERSIILDKKWPIILDDFFQLMNIISFWVVWKEPVGRLEYRP